MQFIVLLCLLTGLANDPKPEAPHHVSHQDLDVKLNRIASEQHEQDVHILTSAQKLIDVDERVKNIERLEAPERLAKLETISNENQIYLRCVVGGLVLLLVEMILRRALAKKNGGAR